MRDGGRQAAERAVARASYDVRRSARCVADGRHASSASVDRLTAGVGCILLAFVVALVAGVGSPGSALAAVIYDYDATSTDAASPTEAAWAAVATMGTTPVANLRITTQPAKATPRASSEAVRLVSGCCVAAKAGPAALKETRTGLGFTGHGADRLAERGVRTPDAPMRTAIRCSAVRSSSTSWVGLGRSWLGEMRRSSSTRRPTRLSRGIRRVVGCETASYDKSRAADDRVDRR